MRLGVQVSMGEFRQGQLADLGRISLGSRGIVTRQLGAADPR